MSLWVTLSVLLLPVGFPSVSYHGSSTITENAQNIMDNKQKWTVHEFKAANETHFYIIPIFSCFSLRTQPGVQTGFSFALDLLHQISTFSDSVETMYSYRGNLNIKELQNIQTVTLTQCAQYSTLSSVKFLIPPDSRFRLAQFLRHPKIYSLEFDKFALSLTIVRNRVLFILTLLI